MNKSIGFSGTWTIKTASTTISMILKMIFDNEYLLAISGVNLLFRAVLATFIKTALSTYLYLKLSKNVRASFLASSYPSVITLGWIPSANNLSAYFINAPINRTLLVVPSPIMSSWAVALLAIMAAVGCWICISDKRTAPSLVNFIYPAPPTNIFSVPLGPRLDLITSIRPAAALMFIANAWYLRSTSALELTN